MAQRIGVFICECGPNIKDALDIEELLRFTGQMESVVLAKPVPLLCTPDAGESVASAIRRHDLDRVVFAGCSPAEHEKTFQDICSKAGLNPFLIQLANIREQCAWVIADRQEATEKAKALISGAVHRVRHHLPLTIREIDCCTDVLVIGAGAAGISAAKTLAQKGRRVFLVERSPCIGGKAVLYENLFPDLACAACLLEGDLDAVLHNDRIEVLTLGEVSAVRGYAGNFRIIVQQQPRFINSQLCIGCGDCLSACPVELPNEYNSSLDHRAAITIPYPGALPHRAVIDQSHCLRFNGTSCSACKDACAFDAVDFDQQAVTRELEAGAVVVATGFDLFDAVRTDHYGDPTLDNVITSFAFERLVNTAGPTDGRIVLADGRAPASVAFLHCVGSRVDTFNAHCSAVCCLHSFKHARQVAEQLPEALIHHIFADLCLPGKNAQRFFGQLQSEASIALHRMDRPDAAKIVQENGKTIIAYKTQGAGIKKVEAQLVVLAVGMEPPEGSRELAQTIGLQLDEDGFFQEAHPINAPVESSLDGVFLAGCCQGPKDIPSAVAQGQAAAGQILQKWVPGEKIVLEPMVARVDADLCSGCQSCLSLCPFAAVSKEPADQTVRIQETLCRGCGICAAACPGGAITVCHFGRSAVAAELKGLVNPGEK